MATTQYPLTRQGVRDLDHPIHPTPPTSRTGRVNVGPGERAACTLGGGVLAGLGLGNGGLMGLLLAAAGAALAYRGVTGHFPGYAAAGINTAR